MSRHYYADFDWPFLLVLAISVTKTVAMSRHYYADSHTHSDDSSYFKQSQSPPLIIHSLLNVASHRLHV